MLSQETGSRFHGTLQILAKFKIRNTKVVMTHGESVRKEDLVSRICDLMGSIESSYQNREVQSVTPVQVRCALQMLGGWR